MTRNDNKIIRAAIYIRVSSEEQVRHGYSLQSQKERLIEYCKQNNYKIIELYADEGKSARSKLKNRTELLRLIDDAKLKKFDRIVFWRLDRWFRNIADYYKIQEILDQNKIDWECSDEEYNNTTSNGRLHLNIKLSIAQNESDQTSDRIKFNFENMVKNGRAIFGSDSCTIGFMVCKQDNIKKIVKNPNEIDLMNYIIDTYELNNSLRKTSYLANSKFNVSTTPEQIKRALKNSMLYGSYRNVDNYCEPYITKQRWLNIQELFPKNIKENHKKHEYIFSGLLICGCCGHKLSGGRAANGQYFYRCSYYKNTRLCDTSNYINENTIEKYLLNNFNNIKEKEIKFQSIIENTSNNKNYDLELDNLNKKNERASELYINGNITKEKYDKLYLETIKKINELKKEKQNKKKQKKIISLPSKFIDLYQSLNNEGKRSFWREYIECMEINKKNKEVIKIYLKNVY